MNATPPVLFLIFNRRDAALESLARIREARPARMFVAADGPRPHKEGEAEKCAETRAAVLDAIDWPCEVKTLLRETNLGCGRAVSGAADWFFENVESGIVVEDDCVLSKSFFPFAAELLERYKNDTRVLCVSANCFQPPGTIKNASYYFSKYPHCWGWASWRRAWKLFADANSKWEGFVASGGLKKLNEGCPVFDRVYIDRFNEIRDKKLNTWAAQWRVAAWVNGGMLTILPAVNMVRNTGSGADATHTFDSFNWASNLPAMETTFPLVHPAAVVRNAAADRWTDVHLFHIRRMRSLILFLSRFTILRIVYHKIFAQLFKKRCI